MIIIPTICTLMFAIITFALMPKSEDRFDRASLVLSSYGIVVFVILRNLLGNTSGYTAKSPEQGIIMDRIIDLQVGMLTAGIAVLLLSLLLAVVFTSYSLE